MSDNLTTQNRKLLALLKTDQVQPVTTLAIKAFGSVSSFTCKNKNDFLYDNWRQIAKVNRKKMLEKLLDNLQVVILLSFLVGLVTSAIRNNWGYVPLVMLACLVIFSIVWVAITYLILYREEKKFSMILNLALNDFIK